MEKSYFDFAHNYFFTLSSKNILCFVNTPFEASLIAVSVFVALFVKDSRDYNQKDIKVLLDAIIVMVKRIYFIGDKIPRFQNYCESSKTWSFVYKWAPIFVFKCFTKEVECLIQQRDVSLVENVIANESTPLNIV